MKMLNELSKLLKPYGIKTNLYIDRLHLYLDSSTTKAHLQKLLPSNDDDDIDTDDQVNNKLTFHQLPGHAYLDRKLELLQPDMNALKFLNDPKVVRGDCRIQYVELALDFEVSIAQDSEILKTLEKFFDKHLVYEKRSQGIEDQFYWATSTGKKSDECDEDEWTWKVNEKGTRYFAPRKSGNVLVMYRREKSKISSDKACLHLEWRFSGIAQLKAQGIITLQQLIDFDHVGFWNHKLDLREPNYTALGYSGLLTRQAHYNRGKNKWSGIPVLQQFLQREPYSSAAFTPITTANKLHHCLKLFFTGH